MDHPIQPIERDEHGFDRFKKNRLVDALVDAYGLNELYAKYCHETWFRCDYDQLMQLVGYSVSGAPISDMCRGRVECLKQNMEPSFSAGYSDGFNDAIVRIRGAIEDLESEK